MQVETDSVLENLLINLTFTGMSFVHLCAYAWETKFLDSIFT